MVSAAGIFNFIRPYVKPPTNDWYIWQIFVIYGYLSQRGNSAFLQILALCRFAPTLSTSKWNGQCFGKLRLFVSFILDKQTSADPSGRAV